MSYIQDAINAGARRVTLTGNFFAYDPIVLRSDLHIDFAGYKVTQMPGCKNLFEGPENLLAVKIDGGYIKYQGDDHALDYAFDLKSFYGLEIDLKFEKYDDASLVRIVPTSAATINTSDFNIRLKPRMSQTLGSCVNGVVLIGYEKGSHVHTGDGTAAVINTGNVWPELRPAAVTVLHEASDGSFTELTRGTDYTVSFDGSGVLSVTPLAAIPVRERWYIFNSQAVADDRKPITAGTIDIMADCRKHGILGVRWTDGLNIEGLLRPSYDADGYALVRGNPYASRSGEGLDHITFRGMTFNLGQGDPAKGVAIDMGPGCSEFTGHVCFDGYWEGETQIKKPADIHVDLSGTWAVSGTSMTGTGGKATEELVLSDKLLIDKVYYAISSINGDNSVTLTGSAPADSGLTVQRMNMANGTSAHLICGGMGDGMYTDKPYRVGVVSWGLTTHDHGRVAIKDGNTSIAVPVALRRAPVDGEVTVTPVASMPGDNWWVEMTAAGFTIHQNVDAEITRYQWSVTLGEL